MRARASGSAGRSGGVGKRSSRYSLITSDSTITWPSTSSAGILPSGLIFLYSGEPRPPGRRDDLGGEVLRVQRDAHAAGVGREVGVVELHDRFSWERSARTRAVGRDRTRAVARMAVEAPAVGCGARARERSPQSPGIRIRSAEKCALPPLAREPDPRARARPRVVHARADARSRRAPTTSRRRLPRPDLRRARDPSSGARADARGARAERAHAAARSRRRGPRRDRAAQAARRAARESRAVELCAGRDRSGRRPGPGGARRPAPDRARHRRRAARLPAGRLRARERGPRRRQRRAPRARARRRRRANPARARRLRRPALAGGALDRPARRREPRARGARPTRARARLARARRRRVGRSRDRCAAGSTCSPGSARRPRPSACA